ncbi:MAG: DUF4258 domain-containing protein [Rhabdochlamydiaceae bacterium]|jgi:hypothetical protein
MKPSLPVQIENLLEKVKESIATENYRFSWHAIQRGEERLISFQDTLYVLVNGVHEEKKSSFDSKNRTWKYAIRGKTTDGFDTRVIIAFEKEMVIITVIRLITVEKKFRKRPKVIKKRRKL